ncbi:MAG: LacI family DNA-binding transcriptional regulator [Verrucomicrobiota bacterium]
MNHTLRQIAARLGLSASTVSRALHRDPLVNKATMERVLAAVGKAGYQLDPVVSAGMSKIRRRHFYRETLAWCGDSPRESMPWLAPLFGSFEDYGARLGYNLECFHFERPTPRSLARQAAVWRARGIRGVLLGPFRSEHTELPFRWEELAWIMIGHPPESPVLHSVGRDYESDIKSALAWLEARGCRRPCFILDPGVNHLFKEPMLRASLLYYEGRRARPKAPLHELASGRPELFAAWVEANRPDGLILPRSLRPSLRRLIEPVLHLPRISLSPPDSPGARGTAHFTARYEVMGQVAVNLLHRLLSNREFGLPAYKQTIVLDSRLNG